MFALFHVLINFSWLLKKFLSSWFCKKWILTSIWASFDQSWYRFRIFLWTFRQSTCDKHLIQHHIALNNCSKKMSMMKNLLMRENYLHIFDFVIIILILRYVSSIKICLKKTFRLYMLITFIWFNNFLHRCLTILKNVDKIDIRNFFIFRRVDRIQ